MTDLFNYDPASCTQSAVANCGHTSHNQIGRIHNYLASRKEDAGKVFALILENNQELPLTSVQVTDGEYKSISDIRCCNVVLYARPAIDGGDSRYRVVCDNGVIYHCDDLSHVVETVLRVWW